jgi:hypothetical protein|nr:MAG TPA: hypothetical protein [Bacteriophage sp.]
MTNYTTNFNLEKYQNGDAANLNDQYNASMNIIDDNLYKINTNANTAGGKATQALETAQNNNKNLTALGVTDTKTATQLKNKIDTTATNLAATTETANNAADNLNALGANTVKNATNLKNRINDTYTKNESDNRYVQIPVTQDTLIAIGDSYFEGFRTTNPATDSMIVKAAKKLGLKCNNYAVGGSGFITGTTFLQQLQRANSATTDKTKIKYVVIGGGRNDAYNTLKESDVVAALTYAKTNFPYSKIVFIPMMYDNTWPTRDDGQKYGVMCAGGRNANVLTVKDAPSWGLYYHSGMTDIHPNTEGSEIYAQYIATAIQTNATAMPRVERHIDVALPGVTDGTLSVFINGLDISYVFRGNKTEWNQNIFATVNKSNTWGAWSMLMGFLDDSTPLKLKFDGMNFSIIDVLNGTGKAGIVNFTYNMNIFEHN